MVGGSTRKWKHVSLCKKYVWYKMCKWPNVPYNNNCVPVSHTLHVGCHSATMVQTFKEFTGVKKTTFCSAWKYETLLIGTGAYMLLPPVNMVQFHGLLEPTCGIMYVSITVRHYCFISQYYMHRKRTSTIIWQAYMQKKHSDWKSLTLYSWVLSWPHGSLLCPSGSLWKC